MATHSSLAWKIPWTKEPGGLQSMGLQRVTHDGSDLARTHTHTHNPSYEVHYSHMTVSKPLHKMQVWRTYPLSSVWDMCMVRALGSPLLTICPAEEQPF